LHSLKYYKIILFLVDIRLSTNIIILLDYSYNPRLLLYKQDPLAIELLE